MYRLLFSISIFLLCWIPISSAQTQQDPNPQQITLTNVDKLTQLGQIGYGHVQQLDWIAEQNQLVVVSTQRVLLYDDYGSNPTSEPTSYFTAMSGEILSFYHSNERTKLLMAPN